MRFQGENCTLSFGLYFDSGQVLLTGTLWPRPPASGAAHSPRTQPPRLRFQSHLSESQLNELRHWLLNGSSTPFALAEPIRYIRRLPTQPDGLVQFDMELSFDQVPPWWDWAVVFPLTVRVEVRLNEFTYLTNALQREYWSADLTW